MIDMQNAEITISDRQKQIGSLLAAILSLVGLALLIFETYVVVVLQNGKMDVSDQGFIPLSIIVAVVNLIGFVFIRRGRHNEGAWASYAVTSIALPIVATLVLKNIYPITASSIIYFTIIFAQEVFPVTSKKRVLWTAVIALLVIAVIEIWNPGFRIGSGLSAQTFSAAVIAFTSIGLLIFLLQRALRGNIRSKIVAGILLTGGVSIAIISFFAISRSGQLINILSERVEISVNLLAEEQLLNTVSSEANTANDALEATVSQLVSLADQLEILQEQETSLRDGTYWDSSKEMFQLSDGQYVNTVFDPGSVFIPSTVNFTDSVASELNVTAYLDFSAPFVIENNRQILAVYFTNLDGIITYYPNNGYGRRLPHDYNATEQSSFSVATPLLNPQREPLWSFLRQDPSGAGLIISVSAPVYIDEDFAGVMTADFKFDKIAEDINAIQVGSSGYAFLIDKNGHIISMPSEGYLTFGIQPEELDINQEPQQTIFDGNYPLDIRRVTQAMANGESGIVSTDIGGTETFIAYAPVAGKEFSLGIIVPVSELTQPVITTQNDIDSQVKAALRNAAVILVVLLASAILVSLGLGQLISAPLLRLTQTANQILEGNLAAQAEITTKDETGTLAHAFNAVTAQLGQTLAGLEQTVEERTSELSVASQNNERRAKQFQSISQVARTISSTLDFDSLLTQITTVISHEFGFYHVGVFLLDTAKEYAVLSAANSEGGQTMLARGHRLKVGEKGLVGFVSSTGRPRVALDTGADAVFFNNPDLPNTRSEIALPLRAGKNVIGVLDVQSTEQNAFSQEDISILSTLADQVSIAIQNARQNEQTQKALAESEALSKQFVQTGWANFTQRQKLLGVRHTGAKTTLLYSKADNTPATNNLKTKGRGALLSIPIKLRGEVIGSVDVQAPDNRQWDQDEMDIVTAIIERAAIAMENARLLTESQKRAAKERTIGEISAKISAQSEVEDLLKTAAQELNRTLPGTEVSIQFTKDEVE